MEEREETEQTPQSPASFLKSAWRDYLDLNPALKHIESLIEERGDGLVHDHVAFRTFGASPVSLEELEPRLLRLGYTAGGSYRFEEKKLTAKHYEHRDASQPKVFLSQLQLERCSDFLRKTVEGLVRRIPGFGSGPGASGADGQPEAGESGFRRKLETEAISTGSADSPGDFLISGRLWPPITFEDYRRLREESEYAAWLAVFGFRPNHFTVSINHLKTFGNLREFNAFMKEKGFSLNTSGGEVKGSPGQYLEQSSTRAQLVDAEFAEGRRSIPGCYYEFAQRYPMEDGALFQGFIEGSADKIFESTDNRSP